MKNGVQPNELHAISIYYIVNIDKITHKKLPNNG